MKSNSNRCMALLFFAVLAAPHCVQGMDKEYQMEMARAYRQDRERKKKEAEKKKQDERMNEETLKIRAVAESEPVKKVVAHFLSVLADVQEGLCDPYRNKLSNEEDVPSDSDFGRARSHWNFVTLCQFKSIDRMLAKIDPERNKTKFHVGGGFHVELGESWWNAMLFDDKEQQKECCNEAEGALNAFVWYGLDCHPVQGVKRFRHYECQKQGQNCLAQLQKKGFSNPEAVEEH